MNPDLHCRPQFALLTEEECRRIHGAALSILRRTGCRIDDAEACRLLAAAGAIVGDDGVVKFPEGLVEWALGKAPSQITLCRRGSNAAAVILADDHVNFGPGSDTVFYHHPTEGRRKFTLDDVAACTRLVDGLAELDFCMSMGIPAEVAPPDSYISQYATMVTNTTKPIVFVCDDRRDCEVIHEMAATIAGGEAQLRLNPTLLLYSEPITPLLHPVKSTQKLLYMARHGLPIVHSPAPMMGGTAPVTLAGGLALGNAEILSSLVMHQLAREGAPFVYGAGVHHLDMGATISVYGAPEFQLARAALADMARFYCLPSWGYAGCSDAPVPDGQALADVAYQVRDALMMRANLVHDVGYLEGGIAFSPEMVVFAAEMIAMHRRFVKGFSIDEESLALDVIHEVGPGGSFMAENHTLQHFRDYWFPRRLERRRHEKWRDKCGRDLQQRIRAETLALLTEHEAAPLSSEQHEQLEATLRRGR